MLTDLSGRNWIQILSQLFKQEQLSKRAILAPKTKKKVPITEAETFLEKWAGCQTSKLFKYSSSAVLAALRIKMMMMIIINLFTLLFNKLHTNRLLWTCFNEEMSE